VERLCCGAAVQRTKPGRLDEELLEYWKNGRKEKWNNGRLEYWEYKNKKPTGSMNGWAFLLSLFVIQILKFT